MRKDVKLYNIIFPMWSIYFFGLLFPPLLLILLPANFAADTLFLLLLFWKLGLPEKKKLYWKGIWKTWGFGFLADVISSAIFLALSELIDFHKYGINIYRSIQSAEAFLFTTAAVALAGFLIYFFHMKWVWNKVELEAGQKRKIALGMAILTAPYLMYLPPM